MGMSNVKQEALNLLDRLNAAEMQRDELIYETKNVLTPAEEREKLLKQIKENNEEISTLEKQFVYLAEKIIKIFKFLKLNNININIKKE